VAKGKYLQAVLIAGQLNRNLQISNALIINLCVATVHKSIVNHSSPSAYLVPSISSGMERIILRQYQGLGPLVDATPIQSSLDRPVFGCDLPESRRGGDEADQVERKRLRRGFTMASSCEKVPGLLLYTLTFDICFYHGSRPSTKIRWFLRCYTSTSAHC
jgi:hypothetical protein